MFHDIININLYKIKKQEREKAAGEKKLKKKSTVIKMYANAITKPVTLQAN